MDPPTRGVEQLSQSDFASVEFDDGMKPRNMAAAARALQGLQRTGNHLIEAARSRERVIAMMRVYMRRLAIDVDGLPPVIHIAGTKGKGSTASMCESILRSAGLRTALFTSPHLISVRERFRLDGHPVDEARYLSYFWSTWDTLRHHASSPQQGPASSPLRATPHSPAEDEDTAALPAMPGFFHFLTLLALRMFHGEGAEVAVLEVGLGGRLDATNAVPRPLVCGVTTLDFDHMDVLGDTLPQIAREKAGIFKRGVPALTVPQRPDALLALRECAQAAGAPLLLVEPRSLLRRGDADAAAPLLLGLEGTFQQTNAALAVALADVFMWERGRQHLLRDSTAAIAPILDGCGAASGPLCSEASPANSSGVTFRSDAENGGSSSPLLHHAMSSSPTAAVPSAVAPWQRFLLSCEEEAAAGVTGRGRRVNGQGESAVPAVVRVGGDLRAESATDGTAPTPISHIAARLHPRAAEGELNCEPLPPPSPPLPAAADVVIAVFDAGSEPLAPHVRKGLRDARWSGRAQVLRVPVAAGVPVSSPTTAPSPPSSSASCNAPVSPHYLTLYLDGAHTERSLQECVAWFRSRMGSGIAGASESNSTGSVRKQRHTVLLFYCGPEKDVIQLLLPLSTLHLDGVILTAPAWVRPSRHSLPTVQEALDSFQRRGGTAGGPVAVQCLPPPLVPTDDAAAAATSAYFMAPRDAAGGDARAPSTPAPWLQTLRVLWGQVHSNPALLPLRARMALPPQAYSLQVASGGGEAAAVAPGAGLSATGAADDIACCSSPPTVILPTVAAAVAELRALAAAHADDREYHVLVTGSLYLVGSVLEAVGWTEG